jgi:hypothetical protein
MALFVKGSREISLEGSRDVALQADYWAHQKEANELLLFIS